MAMKQVDKLDVIREVSLDNFSSFASVSKALSVQLGDRRVARHWYMGLSLHGYICVRVGALFMDNEGRNRMFCEVKDGVIVGSLRSGSDVERNAEKREEDLIRRLVKYVHV